MLQGKRTTGVPTLVVLSFDVSESILRQDKSGKGECSWAETFRRNLAGMK